jgi:hypothetical protein
LLENSSLSSRRNRYGHDLYGRAKRRVYQETIYRYIYSKRDVSILFRPDDVAHRRELSRRDICLIGARNANRHVDLNHVALILRLIDRSTSGLNTLNT